MVFARVQLSAVNEINTLFYVDGTEGWQTIHDVQVNKFQLEHFYLPLVELLQLLTVILKFMFLLAEELFVLVAQVTLVVLT